MRKHKTSDYCIGTGHKEYARNASKRLIPPLTCTKLIEVDLLLLGSGVRVSASFREKNSLRRILFS